MRRFSQNSEEAVLCALAANVLFFVFWVLGLLLLYRSCEYAHAAAWLLVVTMFFPQQNMEWRWVASAVVLLVGPVAAQMSRGRGCFMATCAGVVLALVAYMKFSALIVVAAAHITILVVALRVHKKDSCFLVASWLVSFLMVFVGISCVFFSDQVAFVKWVRGSFDIASGYNKYMLLKKTWIELTLPFAVLGLVVGSLVWRVREKRSLIVAILAFSPVFFCTIKYALVRQSPWPFFYLLAIFLAYMSCVVPVTRRRTVVCVFSLWLIT